MAVYIEVCKILETQVDVTYDYFPEGDKSRAGRLRIEKATGELKELMACPNDESRFYHSRAARRLMMHHEKGEYPQETCWAS